MRSLREVARALANFVFPEAAGPLTKKLLAIKRYP